MSFYYNNKSVAGYTDQQQGFYYNQQPQQQGFYYNQQPQQGFYYNCYNVRVYTVYI